MKNLLGLRCRGLGEKGSSAVELALVLPLFAMLVMAILDFGTTYNNWITVRQGVREGARQGSVANFGTDSTCGLTFTGGGSAPSADLENLMCLTKNQIGLPATATRIKILLVDPTLTTNGQSWTVGNALEVCAEYPAQSITGYFAGLLGGKYLESKTTIRIEAASQNSETEGYETDPTGKAWAWCTPSASSP
jgi:hypothetical protein